ncbi:MAG: hypothetical protein ACTHKD_15695 [Devosia sp.]
MTLPFVSLRPEITRTHAMMLMDWLEDERVTRHLNESRNVSRFIADAIDRTQMPILTHLFNQGGRFLMVCDLGRSFEKLKGLESMIALLAAS